MAKADVPSLLRPQERRLGRRLAVVLASVVAVAVPVLLPAYDNGDVLDEEAAEVDVSGDKAVLV